MEQKTVRLATPQHINSYLHYNPAYAGEALRDEGFCIDDVAHYMFHKYIKPDDTRYPGKDWTYVVPERTHDFPEILKPDESEKDLTKATRYYISRYEGPYLVVTHSKRVILLQRIFENLGCRVERLLPEEKEI